MSEYNFDLERLITARKMRTHCIKWSNGELLDEIVALHRKYHLPEIQALTTQLEASEKREKELGGLLEIANCPQCDGSGAYYDGMGEVCQCQWCDEKAKALTGSEPIQGG